MKTETLKKYEYPASRIQREGWDFSVLTFHAEAGDLSEWAGVYRKDVNQQGYQRILNSDHANQIKKFLANPKNVIPNSVVIAFNDSLDTGSGGLDAAKFTAERSFHPTDSEGLSDKTVTIEHVF